jgi:hypothetical protein
VNEKLNHQSGEQFKAPQAPEAGERQAKTVEHEGHKTPENRSENVEKVKKAIAESGQRQSEDLKKHFAPV